MPTPRLSLSRRREDIRAWWAEHLAAQRNSGQNQVTYCRARDLDPKYFTLWKRKLRNVRAIAERRDPPRLVPVVVRSERAPAASVAAESISTSTAVAIRLTLSNGMSLTLELAAGALPGLVRELASVRC
ncbi:MAG: IS66 family insertion sequence element accessory protein TnpA [Candidatus Binataceae bacterium]